MPPDTMQPDSLPGARRTQRQPFVPLTRTVQGQSFVPLTKDRAGTIVRPSDGYETHHLLRQILKIESWEQMPLLMRKGWPK